MPGSCLFFRIKVSFRVVLIQASPAEFRRAAGNFTFCVRKLFRKPRDGPLHTEYRCTCHHSVVFYFLRGDNKHGR